MRPIIGTRIVRFDCCLRDGSWALGGIHVFLVLRAHRYVEVAPIVVAIEFIQRFQHVPMSRSQAHG